MSCRTVDDQAALVRMTVAGPRLVLDREHRLPGRGAYVHPRCAKALDRAAVARSMRRAIDERDVKRIVVELSPTDDNSPDLSTRDGAFGLGAKGAKPVETPPRITAKE